MLGEVASCEKDYSSCQILRVRGEYLWKTDIRLWAFRAAWVRNRGHGRSVGKGLFHGLNLDTDLKGGAPVEFGASRTQASFCCIAKLTSLSFSILISILVVEI